MGWGALSEAQVDDRIETKLSPITARDVATYLRLLASAELRLADSDSSNYVGFKPPNVVSANKIWTLPAGDGASKQVLATDGAGLLSFIDPNADEINFDDASASQGANGTENTIKTYTLPANTFRKILVLVTGRISFPASLQTAGSFTINLKFGGVTKKSQTHNYPDWATGHAGTLTVGWAMIYAQAQTTSVAIDVTVSGGDVNNTCSVFVDAFYTVGLQ